jgi:hypothetical protein
MAAAASSLKSQAQDLVHTVAVFKLAGSSAGALPSPMAVPFKVAAPVPTRLTATQATATTALSPKAPRVGAPALPKPAPKVGAKVTPAAGDDDWETF